MENELSEIVRKNGNSAKTIDEKFSTIGEVLNSLVSAVSTLQTLNDIEANAFFRNLELKFPKEGLDFHEARKRYEINLVRQALRQTKGHQSNAAKLLKMRATTLNSIIKKYDLLS